MLAERLVAHRGYQKCYPENTLLGLSRAIESGARYIELDVQFSADKQPLIFHDSSLLRICGIPGVIHSMTKEQLVNTPAYEPGRLTDKFADEKIAPLEALTDLLKAHPDITAFVEIKEASITVNGVDEVLDKVGEILHPVIDRCVLISFDYALIAAARLEGWPQVGVVLRTWDDITEHNVMLSRPNYLFTDYKIIPDDANLDLPDCRVVAYEVADPELAKSLFEQGVDMIESFDMPGLLEKLGHQAL